MPAAYLIADVTVTNEAQMAEYRQWSSRAMREHGAEVLVRGGTLEPQGDGRDTRRWYASMYVSDHADANHPYVSPM